MAARNRLYAVFLGNPVQPGLERRSVGRYQAALPRECRYLTRAGHRPSKRAEPTDRQGKTDADHCSHSSSPRAHRISGRRSAADSGQYRAAQAGKLPGVVARRSNHSHRPKPAARTSARRFPWRFWRPSLTLWFLLLFRVGELTRRADGALPITPVLKTEVFWLSKIVRGAVHS